MDKKCVKKKQDNVDASVWAGSPCLGRMVSSEPKWLAPTVLTLFFFLIPEAEPALEGNHQGGGEAVAQQPLFCRMNTSRLSPWTKNRPGGPSN